MTKPSDYREQRVVIRDTDYHPAHPSPQAARNISGTLSTGRVVWIQNSSATLPDGATVFAYAEGLGIVALDSHSLKA